ncbi:MAG TPA: RhuM family protein, partial [Puia sp.]|nr:RhuM family protein [Puia sp.]
MKEKGDIIFYQSGSDNIDIEVKLEGDSVWLSLNQIAVLFGKDKSVISRHLSNMYREGEINRESTVAKNATVQTEGERKISREIEYYNLDAILSVGYRVNSIRGTQFRIWANQVLKDHLVKGYSFDKRRFQEQSRQLDELKQTVKLLGNVVGSKDLNSDE